MKILVIFTGGTIGSAVASGYIAPSNKSKYQLIEHYNRLKKREVDFEYIEPYTLLSEDVTGDYLRKLGKCLLSQDVKKYDGIIVTHGTDTVQYSAACMTYLLSDIQIPVLFVSSNYILDDERSNGLDNFAYAVEFIAEKQGKGVFIVYRNSDNIVYIHRGSRVMPHLPCDDNLYSIGEQCYGCYKEGSFIANSNYHVGMICKEKKLSLPMTWNSGILRVFPYPGMEYPLNIEGIRAVLLDSYHSGTICSITPNMKTFFGLAKKKDVPVFLAGGNYGIDYESIKLWENMGISVLPQASPIAMYIKLWMALDSDNTIDLANTMRLSVSEEIIS